MSEESFHYVNFDRPIPIFPLDTVALFPYQLLPIHIFEPRYRQMVERAIDGPGQFAMAVFRGARWRQEYHGRPPVHDAVCIGHIVEHEKLSDGRFNVLLQGIFRARIVHELPASSERLYREAMLEPIPGPDTEDETSLDGLRERLEHRFSDGPLTEVRMADPLLEHIRNEQVPPEALLELLAFTLVTDSKLRYRLLAEGSVVERADIIENELDHLSALIRQAAKQHPDQWPKGCSWN